MTMLEPLTQLAREAQRRYYGKYRGFVASNSDPDRLGRLQLRVPSVLGAAATGWALPCLPFGGLPDQGWFAVPEKDAQVWVEFEEGDLSRPIWTGTFWQQKGDPPQEAALDPPTTRLLKTPGGHLVELDDKKDAERFLLIHPKGAKVEIDQEGTVAVTDAKGAKVTLDAKGKQIVVADANGNTLTMSSSGTTVEDANGNKVEMAAAGVTVEGKKVVVKGQLVSLGGEGGEPLLKGASFVTLFATHTHGTSAPGAPTTPPIPAGDPTSALSKKVTTA